MSILDESAISLATAARLIPGQPHVSTVWRWTIRGVRGVCLETFTVGGKRFTTKEALRRFLLASQPSNLGVQRPGVASYSERNTSQVLRRAGISGTAPDQVKDLRKRQGKLD